MRKFTLEEALANPMNHHWTEISFVEVMGGYCAILNNRWSEVEIESPVMESLEELICGLMPAICYGSSVSPYDDYGHKFLNLIGISLDGLVEKGSAYAILGHTYYHGIGGHYAFEPNDKRKAIKVLPAGPIAKKLAEMLLTPRIREINTYSEIWSNWGK